MDGRMKKEDIHKLAIKRMSAAADADRENRLRGLDDMEFLAGRQWPETERQARENASRPVITVNRLPQFVRQVTGDIRRLNPGLKVVAGDNQTSPDGAELVEGLIRQIEYASNASGIYEGAAESAAQCGIGNFRILADYTDPMSFEQEICIKPIRNPFSVYWDPDAREPTRKDARFVFILETMSEEDFKEAYPGASANDFTHDGESEGQEHWRTGSDVVVGEYIWLEPESVKLGLTVDGQVIENPEKDDPGIVKTRTTQRDKVMWAKLSGTEVLEGPQRLAGRELPVVAVVGEELHVGEEIVRNSVIRFAKDPQRLYNYWTTTNTELVALQPKAPYLVTAKQVEGLENLWKQANTANVPYLPYNPDEAAPPPARAVPPQPSSGMINEIMRAAEDMKSTTGIYDAGLGATSNEKSGVAIRQRQMEADISNSIYTDNLAKAIERCGNIIISMIPEIYDTQRVVRILGEDEAEKLVEINGAQEIFLEDGSRQIIPQNNLTIGKYDVRVSVGPNYSTRRQETAESMMQFVQAFPAAAQVSGDLLAKAMDWPDADKIADRLKKTLPPGMIDPEDMDPEEAQQMQQGQAQQMQMAQMQMQAEMQAKASELAKQQAEAQEAQSDARKAQADAVKAEYEAEEARLRLALQQNAAQTAPVLYSEA